MTAEPEDNPSEPRLEPAGGREPLERRARPKPSVIEQPSQPRPGSGGGLLFPLAAGLIGGLVGAGIVYFALGAGGSAKEDVDGRQLIRELQDKTSQLGEEVRAKFASSVVAPAGASSEDLNEVRARIDGLAKAAKAGDDSVQALSQRVQTEDDSVQALSKKVETLEQKPAPEPVAKETIQAEVASQVAPVAERMAALEHSHAERASDARTAALTLALTNLKRAIGEGRPFAQELAAVENLSSGKLPISDLAEYKAKGVPSLSQLQRDFLETVRSVIQKHYHGKSDSIMGEMLSRARAAIQVKPSGGAGDSVEAILGRMETALKAGDLRAALTESAALEGPAKEELQGWVEQAQARAAVDEAVKKTDQVLLESLTKASARR